MNQTDESLRRVLVVEDDRAAQRVLKRLLEAEDLNVELRSDGKAGLDAFRATRPDAVLLDLRLPGIAGDDLCRHIKREAPAVPVIVISAKTNVADKVLLLELAPTTTSRSRSVLVSYSQDYVRSYAAAQGRQRPMNSGSAPSRLIFRQWN